MFSKYIFSILFLIINITLYSRTDIQMVKKNNVYFIPCSVNGLKLEFIFDTGAAMVCLSLSEAIFMLKNGYLTKNDIIGFSALRVANNDIVIGAKIILKEINIGGITLRNIIGTIMPNQNAPLLLG